MSDNIPEDVERTLRQVLQSHKLTLEQDRGVAAMGGPDEEETQEALEWVRNESEE